MIGINTNLISHNCCVFSYQYNTYVNMGFAGNNIIIQLTKRFTDPNQRGHIIIIIIIIGILHI